MAEYTLTDFALEVGKAVAIVGVTGGAFAVAVGVIEAVLGLL